MLPLHISSVELNINCNNLCFIVTYYITAMISFPPQDLHLNNFFGHWQLNSGRPGSEVETSRLLKVFHCPFDFSSNLILVVLGQCKFVVAIVACAITATYFTSSYLLILQRLPA